MINLKNFIKHNRQNSTNVENKLWWRLRNFQTGYKFRRQQQIGKYIVDFVCLQKKLIIECDGGQHNEEADKERSKFLEQEGYKILRFWNNEINENIEGVLQTILSVLEE